MGCSMESRFMIVAFLISGILLITCHAESISSYRSVGGDYGRAWLSNFESHNPEPKTADQNSTNLWTWGGAPKGRAIQNGNLAADPYYIWRSLNYSSGWLGQAYVDQKTGNPVYAYIDPYTGNTVYFYVDPKTGSPVTTNVDTSTGSSVMPFGYSDDSDSGRSGLTGSYGSYIDPWTGTVTSARSYSKGYPRTGLPYYGNTNTVRNDSLGTV